MSQRELRLFAALTNIGDDLVEEGFAFLPAGGGAAAQATVGTPERAGKRPAWFLPAVIAACAALVASAGIAVAVLGNSFQLFPFGPSDTTEEGTIGVSEGEPTDETGEESTGAPTEMPTEGDTDSEEPAFDYNVERNDYGLPFTILYCSDSFHKGYYFENTVSSPTYNLGEEAYQRIKQTEKYLGVDITAMDGGGQGEYYGNFFTSANAGLDEYQLILTHASKGLVSLMTSPYLTDLQEQEGLNLNAWYWEPVQNQRLQVSGKQLIAYSEFLLPDGYVMGFNRGLVKEYFTDTELYRLAEDRGWTLEKMEIYVTSYQQDNGDGMWNEKDSYGLSCSAWTPLIGFVTAADIRVVNQNGGRFSLSALNDKARASAVDSLVYRLMGMTSTYSYAQDENKPLHLQTGQVMFELTSLNDLIRNGEKDTDVGILPYPLYDRDQEDYRTLYTGGYMSMPNTVKHGDMAGDVVETLVYQSQPALGAFLDAVWECGGCTSDQDHVMLNIIESSMTVEQALTLADTHQRMEAIVYAVPRHVMGESAYDTNVSFLWSTVSKKLDDLVKTVKNLHED